ncbi:MAG: hypothetical protein J5X22_21170 [Candidatus Accumulibacter sp.]|uniref:hypothetical protein n=1 Tax=Accumulibacter sp. TaxID=2053492 RepID=UPI001ACE6F10|nr:hypothetical protein [Accumulibacter sp.]MBN8519869.1 hypothetical protein [Accumulibacter sp.]MBO3712903.1 hypothetical protein [Accumulibacter sp.]
MRDHPAKATCRKAGNREEDAEASRVYDVAFSVGSIRDACSYSDLSAAARLRSHRSIPAMATGGIWQSTIVPTVNFNVCNS